MTTKELEDEQEELKSATQKIVEREMRQRQINKELARRIKEKL